MKGRVKVIMKEKVTYKTNSLQLRPELAQEGTNHID